MTLHDALWQFEFRADVAGRHAAHTGASGFAQRLCAGRSRPACADRPLLLRQAISALGDGASQHWV